MVVMNEITTYKEGNMYWADATDVVDISADCAWTSLEPLLMRIIEIPAVAGGSVKVIRVKEDAPVTFLGNRLVARAAMLGGIIKASMSMKVTVSDPPRYLRLAVRTFNMHFADIDFRIHSLESGCRLSYRQGFRSRQNLSRSIGVNTGKKVREMPATARIFNSWVELALEAQQGNVAGGDSQRRLVGG